MGDIPLNYAGFLKIHFEFIFKFYELVYNERCDF